jgi:hypothetical protein
VEKHIYCGVFDGNGRGYCENSGKECAKQVWSKKQIPFKIDCSICKVNGKLLWQLEQRRKDSGQSQPDSTSSTNSSNGESESIG